MPASDISRISLGGVPQSSFIANIAKEIAKSKIASRLKDMKELTPKDRISIENEYRAIYSMEYYKHYAMYLQQDQQANNSSRIIYVPTENPTSKKYITWHTAVNFSRKNCLIRCHRGRITISTIKYPIDADLSPETKESFISLWPGPLDRPEVDQSTVVGYIETLRQYDSQRRIKYSSTTNDDHRKIILKLLTELLNRKGTIDAPGVSRLLLNPEETEIKKVESERYPLATLQKYLLLGKRSEAIKYAKSKNLWDHAQCLAFLDKYQPPRTTNYIRDTSTKRLRDDPIVQLNDEYIANIGKSDENDTLGTVYRSLLNRIIQSDPESVNFIKSANVENDPYYFAIMCANDCDIEFDRSNEVFKLIMAVKQAKINPALAEGHLISLGFALLDAYDPYDDISAHSLSSHRQFDLHSPNQYSRTRIISNIDMLILNEIWEYCLNLPRNLNQAYKYILDLVPYKLIFATRLLDYGLYQMFNDYLSSIKQALIPLRNGEDRPRDRFYDWDTIINAVDYLETVWGIVHSEDYQPDNYQTLNRGIANLNVEDMYSSETQSLNYNPADTLANPVAHSEVPASEYPDAPDFGYTSLPYQQPQYQSNQSYPPWEPSKQAIPPQFYNPPIQEEVNDFNPEPSEPGEPQYEGSDPAYEQQQYQQQPPPQSYNDHSNDISRRQSHVSQSGPYESLYSPPSYGMPGTSASAADRMDQKTMTSSSPVHKGRDSMPPSNMMGESFNSPYSPINENDDLPRSDLNRRDSGAPSYKTNLISNSQPMSGSNANEKLNQPDNGNMSADNNNAGNNKSQPAGDQQSGFLYGLTTKFSQILPRSQSKQMILPDDNPDKQSIVYDSDQGLWIDKSKPDGGLSEAFPGPPPMMKAASPPEYSFNLKSSKARYARP